MVTTTRELLSFSQLTLGLLLKGRVMSSHLLQEGKSQSHYGVVFVV